MKAEAIIDERSSSGCCNEQQEDGGKSIVQIIVRSLFPERFCSRCSVLPLRSLIFPTASSNCHVYGGKLFPSLNSEFAIKCWMKLLCVWAQTQRREEKSFFRWIFIQISILLSLLDLHTRKILFVSNFARIFYLFSLCEFPDSAWFSFVSTDESSNFKSCFKLFYGSCVDGKSFAFTQESSGISYLCFCLLFLLGKLFFRRLARRSEKTSFPPSLCQPPIANTSLDAWVGWGWRQEITLNGNLIVVSVSLSPFCVVELMVVMYHSQARLVRAMATFNPVDDPFRSLSLCYCVAFRK